MPSRTAVAYAEEGAQRSPWAALAWHPWRWATQARAFWGTVSISLLAPATGRRA
jgi:hypothetical protein